MTNPSYTTDAQRWLASLIETQFGSDGGGSERALPPLRYAASSMLTQSIYAPQNVGLIDSQTAIALSPFSPIAHLLYAEGKSLQGGNSKNDVLALTISHDGERTLLNIFMPIPGATRGLEACGFEVISYSTDKDGDSYTSQTYVPNEWDADFLLKMVGLGDGALEWRLLRVAASLNRDEIGEIQTTLEILAEQYDKLDKLEKSTR